MTAALSHKATLFQFSGIAQIAWIGCRSEVAIVTMTLSAVTKRRTATNSNTIASIVKIPMPATQNAPTTIHKAKQTSPLLSRMMPTARDPMIISAEKQCPIDLVLLRMFRELRRLAPFAKICSAHRVDRAVRSRSNGASVTPITSGASPTCHTTQNETPTAATVSTIARAFTVGLPSSSRAWIHRIQRSLAARSARGGSRQAAATPWATGRFSVKLAPARKTASAAHAARPMVNEPE